MSAVMLYCGIIQFCWTFLRSITLQGLVPWYGKYRGSIYFCRHVLICYYSVLLKKNLVFRAMVLKT